MLSLFGLLLFSTSSVFAQLTFSPEKIMAGEKVSVSYDPQGTPLESEEAIIINVYQFDNEEFEVVEIPVKFDAGKFTGSFTTAKSTKAVLFGITNTETDIEDTRDKKGYKTICYQADRKTPVEGAYASKAYIVGRYGRMTGMDTDAEKAMKLLAKEFKHYPTSEKNINYQSLHLGMASATKNEEAIEAHGVRVAQILKNKKATKEELAHAYSYTRIKKDKEGGEKVKAQILAAFPKGSMAANEASSKIRSAKDLAAKVAVLEDFNKTFGDDESLSNTKNYMLGVVASAYSKEEDWDNYKKYLNMIADPSRRAGSLNSVTWPMTGESLKGEAKNPEMAQKLSKQSLEILEAEMKDMTSKPKAYTQRQYERMLKSSYAMFADTYALLAYKNGQMEEALNYQLISCENNKFSNGEMTQRYCAYYEKVNSPKETEALVANFISEGKASSMMKEQHKRLYMANNTMDTAYDKYVVQLEKSALEKKRAELEEKMLDMPSPKFNLVNLEGNKVNIDDLKGKVVVVDFWATWCGPCKASFPGMQQAVNKFADSEDVEFVFIDTWESGEGVTDKVSKFIEDNKYSFNVLMDLDAKVVASFGVSGIPTKFVIDKNGVIRFKSVGFGGNDAALVDEMTMMIELAGGTVPSPVTGAP